MALMKHYSLGHYPVISSLNFCFIFVHFHIKKNTNLTETKCRESEQKFTSIITMRRRERIMILSLHHDKHQDHRPTYQQCTQNVISRMRFKNLCNTQQGLRIWKTKTIPFGMHFEKETAFIKKIPTILNHIHFYCSKTNASVFFPIGLKNKQNLQIT